MPRDVKRHRWWLYVILLASVLIALVAWVIPIRYIGGLRVENTRLLQYGEADGSTKPADLATKRRIELTFSTPNDLSLMRKKAGFGIIRATLSACDDRSAATSEVVSQRDGYSADYGRVRLFPQVGMKHGRYRYRAVFDDRLTKLTDHQFRDQPAVGNPGGLCFSLGGGSMWFGFLWSNNVKVGL